MRALAAVCLVLTMAGCGITREQRAEILDAAEQAARARVEKELRATLEARIAEEVAKAKAGGATPEQIAALEAKMRGEAEAMIRAESDRAGARARELADRATPQPDPEGGGWLGKLIALGLQALLMTLAGGKKT